MERLLVTTFRNARDNVPNLHEVDWSGLVTMLAHHRIMPADGKMDAPALCPAEYTHGKKRSKRNVERVWFGALDYDKLTSAEFERVLECTGGLSCVLYTTWSHAARHAVNGSWSFRLVVAFNRPVEAAEWDRFWPRFHARMGSLGDTKCKDPSRLYFLPSAESAEGCVVETQEGEPLSVDELLGMADPDLLEDKPQAIGRADLEDLASRLVRRRSPNAKAAARGIREALAGRPFADFGDRDNQMFRIACLLAEEWPHGDPAAMAGCFATSIAEMEKVAPNCPTVDDMADKIGRKQVEVRQREAEEEERRRQAVAQRIKEAFKGQRSDPYSDDELNGFAAQAGVNRGEFMRRWIVQVGKSFYLYKGGAYGPSVGADEMPLFAERDLAAATTAGVAVWKVNQQGNPTLKSVNELAQQYGTVASNVVADLSAQRSYFDLDTETIVEAPCPVRDLEPVMHQPVIDYWAALAGNQAEKLLDWVAVVANLSEPCAAVYLDGVPGSGKTLFAESLSRLWTFNGPTPLSEVVGNFNEYLLKCPLVFADEVMPDILKRTEGTGELRQLIQARQLSLKRKYRPTASIRGSVRIIMAANNKHLLETGELLTPDDIAAVAERILYINASAESRRVLEALGYDTVRKFVTADHVAQTALWLRQNREVSRKERFLVSGTDSALHRSLSTSRGLPSAICHWCVSYLLDPGKMDVTGKLLVRVHNGELLVTARALSESWEMYPTNMKAPAAGKISRALSSLSTSKKQLPAGNGKPTNYWPIKGENLKTWNEEMGYCTDEEIDAGLAQETSWTPGGGA